MQRPQGSKTWGIKYLCELCDPIATTTAGDLKKHKDAKYECIRYPCDKSEYAATIASRLKTHEVAKHEGIK